MLNLTELKIYPVAGMGGHDIGRNSMMVTAGGVDCNRSFALVLESEINKYLSEPADQRPLRMTQARFPELALFGTDIRNGNLIITYEDQELDTGISAKAIPNNKPFGNDDIRGIPIDEALSQYVLPYRVSRKAKTDRWAVDCGPEAAVWISEFLRKRGSLQATETARLVQVDPHSPSDKTHLTWERGAHFIVQSSLDKLAEEAGVKRVDPRTMRANGIIKAGQGETIEPFDEVFWQTIVFGGLETSVKMCKRCSYVTNDPDTGEKGTHANVFVAINEKHDKNFGIYVSPNELLPLMNGDYFGVSCRRSA